MQETIARIASVISRSSAAQPYVEHLTRRRKRPPGFVSRIGPIVVQMLCRVRQLADGDMHVFFAYSAAQSWPLPTFVRTRLDFLVHTLNIRVRVRHEPGVR
jgi:hypothetical protein